MRTETIESDLTVVGGGLAGVCAAIAAARLGCRVVLVNNRPVLGGNASSEVRVWVCGATAHGAQKYARETGIMGELFLENQYRNPEGNPVLWDHVVLDAVRAEPGIRLLLNTDVREVDATGPEEARIIRSVTGRQQGTETEYRLTSPLFVDSTGDGLVGALAGAWFERGREAHGEHGEEWAPETADSALLGSTMLFHTKDTGAPVRFVPPASTKPLSSTSILRNRRFDTNDNGCDYWWIEWGGELDTVADDEAIRDELWSVIFGIWDHIKNSGEFDADTLTLEWVGAIPGKREYRRFLGDHVLTQHDIMRQTPFDDRVAFGGWSIDLHPPGGMYADTAGSKHLFTSGVYHIPWRSLYSRNVENMLIAGRDISASHVAFGTTRVMGTCAAIGEAVGTGAALAIAQRVTPRILGRDHLDLLHETLLAQDAPVLGVAWNAENDLALQARATATSTLDDVSVTVGAADEPLSFLPLAHTDLGVHLPVDPALTGVAFLFEANAPTNATVELWSTARGENHIPVLHLASRSVPIARGRSTARIAFDHRPEEPEDVVVLVRRNPALSVAVSDRPAPYGVLGLLSREPRYRAVENAQRPQTNAWSAIELRRRAVVMSVEATTRAYRPENVIGGFARPYGGPALWSSRALRPGRPEAITLEWDEARSVRSIDLVFNDDVDEDIVNLHHHHTPFEVMPEIVRVYDLDVRTAGGWRSVARETNNRRRHRRHTCPRDERIDAVRLTAHSTHGSPWVTVHAIRVFGA